MRAVSFVFLVTFAALVLLTQNKRELLLCALGALSAHYALHLLFHKRHRPPPESAIVITGCSSGIGEDAALTFADLGFHVFATVRDITHAQILTAKATCPHLIYPLLMDVTKQNEIDQTVVAVSAWLSKGASRRLIAVVNNAAYSDTGPLEFQPIQAIRKQFEVNVIGQLAVTQGFIPLLRKGLPLAKKESFYPRIIFISSVGSLVPTIINSPYTATKAAIEHLTDGLRNELKAWGIQVISVLPGAIKSNFESKWSPDKYLDRQDIDPDVAGFYKKVCEKFVNNNMYHAPPYVVTKSLVSAILDKNPSKRYLAGMDAHVLTWLVQLLPEEFIDFIWSFVLRGASSSLPSSTKQHKN